MSLLAGTRVIDLTWHVAGPACTRLLSMAGADVWKVERPLHGDPARSDPWLFTYLNAGKRCVTLDLAAKEGHALLKKAVRRADVVVENFSPGTLEKLGLGYEDLSAVNPRVVLVSISNFGQSGPYRDLTSSDLVAYALGGHLYIQGEPSRPPLRHWGEQAQYQAGAIAATATMAAVFHQLKTGQGQQVDISIMEAVISLLESTVELWTHQDQVRRRSGNRYQWTYPVTMLPCKDGWVVVNAGAERSWEGFCTMMGREDLLADENFRTPMQRVEQADLIDGLLEPWLMSRTREEIFDEAQTWRLPFGPVNRLADVLSDPQLQDREYFTELKTPAGTSATFPGSPAKLSRTPLVQPPNTPAVGEHNKAVFCGELGLTDEEFVQLARTGVI